MSNTPMEDFIPGLNSAVDTIERQPVSNFVGKTIILEKVAKILKEDPNILVKKIRYVLTTNQ